MRKLLLLIFLLCLIFFSCFQQTSIEKQPIISYENGNFFLILEDKWGFTVEDINISERDTSDNSYRSKYIFENISDEKTNKKKISINPKDSIINQTSSFKLNELYFYFIVTKERSLSIHGYFILVLNDVFEGEENRIKVINIKSF